MRNVPLIVFCIILLAAAVVSAEKVQLGGNTDDVTVTVEESSDFRTVVTFELSAFDREAVDINGETYYAIRCGRESRLLNEGEPALPHVCRSIIISDDARMRVTVLSSQYTDIPNTPVVPSKGNLLRSVNPEDVPYTFGGVYGGSDWYPGELASLGEPYIMRDHRGIVIEVSPFQYNPATGTLRVYTSVTVEIVADGPGQTNVLTGRVHADKLIPEFERFYQRRFINYDQVRSADRYTPVEEAGDMLIITHDAFHTAMEPFVAWKMQKGLKTTIVDVSTIGNTSTAIQDYVQDFYDSTNLAWLLLVGDYLQVATPQASGGASDPSYAKLAGGDHYPEIFVGRFSAETVADVETQVERTVAYESNILSADWLHKGTGVASTEGPGHHGEYDNEHMDLIRNDLLAFTYTEVDQFYGSGASSSDVTAALNTGRSIANYCGHGGTTSWSTTGFSNSHVNALTNTDMLPFIISVACVNGNFDGPTCFAEAWLRATDGGQPTGALATYMSSIDQSWSPPMDGQDECIDLLVAEAMSTFGGICFNGSCYMMDVNTGSAGYNMYNTWHIFGDPSVLLYTDIPAALTVNHDPIVLFTDTDFQVEVVGEEGALCAIYYDGVLYGSAYTGSDGIATILFSESLPIGVSVALTITAFNAAPYITDVQVITPSGPYVIYDSYDLDDSGGGNGNGLVEIGEGISLGIHLTNVGPDDALNVEAKISTADTYITITDSTESYGTIAADFGTGYVADGFYFTVASDCPDGHSVQFDLEVTGTARETWYGSFQVPVRAPIVNFVSLTVDDAATGDGNGILDPGETADLIVTLGNSGSAIAYSVDAYLSESDQYLSISDDYGSFGDLDSLTGSGDNTLDVFEVTVDGGCPVGYAVSMDLDVSSGVYSTTLHFNITVGDRVVLYFDDFSIDQGWTGLGGSAEWQIGSVLGNGGDPAEDHTSGPGNEVLGNDLAGKYNSSIPEAQWVTSPLIDCGNMTGVIMSYYHWLGVESNSYDHAYFEVFNGTEWVTLFENGGTTLQESSWILEEYDLSAIADGNPGFQIRFGLGWTDVSGQYAGWNIDDIEFRGYSGSGSSNLVLSPEELTDSLQAGEVSEKKLKVKNTGDGTLGVWFTSNDEWLEFSYTKYTIGPGDSAEFTVTINTAGLSCGDHIGTLSYASNDASHPSGDVTVQLHIYIPDIQVAEESISQTVPGDEFFLYPLVIANDGPGNLNYQVNCQMDMKGLVADNPVATADVAEPLGYRACDPEKSDSEEPFFAAMTKGFGGPDAFGYQWVDSDEPGGPVYDWIDISSVGTELSPGDDNFLGPFSIGFSFPFYDSLYTELYVGSNGYITFDTGYGWASNYGVPYTSLHSSMIAMWWDDIDPSDGGHVYYYHDVAEGRFIVSFEAVPNYTYPDGTGSLTFQVILSASGKIKLQYGTMDPGDDSDGLEGATIGIQNSDASDGLQVVYNAAYMHDNLAITIGAASWLSADPAAGLVDPFSSDTVQIRFDAADMDDGVYTGSLLISSNDPDTPSKSVPVTMTVALSCCVGFTGNVDCDPEDICDVSDLTRLIDYLMISFEPLCCPEEANIDGDPEGVVDVSDLTRLIDYLMISYADTEPCQ